VGAAADFAGFPVSLDGLPAAHLQVLLDGLPVFERYGLLLAGGYAFRAHEILRRPSQDLDFATRNDTPLPETLLSTGLMSRGSPTCAAGLRDGMTTSPAASLRSLPTMSFRTTYDRYR
jgi:hypothetical protein